MKDINTRSKLSLFSIFIFLNKIVSVEKDLFFRFSLFLRVIEDLSSIIAEVSNLFLKVVESLNLSLKDLSSIEVVEDLGSIAAVKVLPLEAYSKASPEASSEALISDFINLL